MKPLKKKETKSIWKIKEHIYKWLTRSKLLKNEWECQMMEGGEK